MTKLEWSAGRQQIFEVPLENTSGPSIFVGPLGHLSSDIRI